MANRTFDAAIHAFYQGQLNLATGTVRAVLIDTALYTPNFATHQFLSDIPSGARVGTPQELINKQFANRGFNADPIEFPTVPAGDPCEALVLYIDTGNESTSRLFLWVDTATGLPVTPSGGDIPVTWNAQGIHRIPVAA